MLPQPNNTQWIRIPSDSAILRAAAASWGDACHSVDSMPSNPAAFHVFSKSLLGTPIIALCNVVFGEAACARPRHRQTGAGRGRNNQELASAKVRSHGRFLLFESLSCRAYAAG